MRKSKTFIYVATTKSLTERVSEGHQSLILQVRNTLGLVIGVHK